MNGRSLLWRMLQTLCRILTSVVFDLKVYGRRHVPRCGGALLVANHQSYLDPIVVAAQLYRPISFMARSGLFSGRFFGWLIRSLHAFPVRQGEGDVGAVKQTIRELKEGKIVNVYPEGSRTEDGQLGPIESGVALIVRRAGVPIIPVAIFGSYYAWPKWRKSPQAYPIRVMYGPPLHAEGLKADQIVQLIDRTLRAMLEELRTKDRL